MKIGLFGLTWDGVTLNLDPFYYYNNIWVIFGPKNKNVNYNSYLFIIANA